MVTYGWGTDGPVEEWLFQEGHRFDFYQAVRMLELIYPDRRPVGEAAAPEREVVRFTSDVSLSFPASDVVEILPPADGEPARMRVNFLGLAGGLGPLPLAYTELVMERVWEKDTAMRDFLDLFNHRLVSLMHRARKLHRIGLDSGPPDESHFAPFLYSFIGLQTDGLKNRMAVRDRSLLFYAGLLAERPRSMAGLQALLADYFGVGIRGHQLLGRWLALEPDQRTAIGLGGRNQILGVDAAIGGRVWDQQGKFELRIGPIPYPRLPEFLPGGDALAPLCALTRFYAGDELEFDLIIEVEPASIPALQIRSRGEGGLGWTSWMGGGGRSSAPREVRVGWRIIEELLRTNRSGQWSSS